MLKVSTFCTCTLYKSLWVGLRALPVSNDETIVCSKAFRLLHLGVLRLLRHAVYEIIILVRKSVNVYGSVNKWKLS
jgi:hypothetical protein